MYYFMCGDGHPALTWYPVWLTAPRVQTPHFLLRRKGLVPDMQGEASVASTCFIMMAVSVYFEQIWDDPGISCVGEWGLGWWWGNWGEPDRWQHAKRAFCWWGGLSLGLGVFHHPTAHDSNILLVLIYTGYNPTPHYPNPYWVLMLHFPLRRKGGQEAGTDPEWSLQKP